MNASQITIDYMVQRWSGMERPLFKGKLIDDDGCKCAQGDVLACAGWTDQQLRELTQSTADLEVADILNISKAHAVWLRVVNDSVGGAPQVVLSSPEQLVGSNAPLLLAFWKHLDTLTNKQWDSVWASVWASVLASVWASVEASVLASVWASVRDSVWASIGASVKDSVGASVWASIGASVEASASMASAEIITMEKREKNGQQPFFLAFYGFKTWADVRALAAH